MGFQFVPKSVTLNDLELRNALILRSLSLVRWSGTHCLITSGTQRSALTVSSHAWRHTFVFAVLDTQRIRGTA